MKRKEIIQLIKKCNTIMSTNHNGVYIIYNSITRIAFKLERYDRTSTSNKRYELEIGIISEDAINHQGILRGQKALDNAVVIKRLLLEFYFIFKYSSLRKKHLKLIKETKKEMEQIRLKQIETIYKNSKINDGMLSLTKVNDSEGCLSKY